MGFGPRGQGQNRLAGVAAFVIRRSANPETAYHEAGVARHAISAFLYARKYSKNER
jgi:hypothetical protein